MIAQRLKLSGMLRGCYRHRNPTLSGSKWALGRSLEVAPHSDERGVTPLPTNLAHTLPTFSAVDPRAAGVVHADVVIIRKRTAARPGVILGQGGTRRSPRRVVHVMAAVAGVRRHLRGIAGQQRATRCCRRWFSSTQHHATGYEANRCHHNRSSYDEPAYRARRSLYFDL